MFNQNNLLKLVRLGVYLSLLTPLIYIPQTIFAAVFGKMVYFQIVIELTLPFFLYLIIFHKDYRPKFQGLNRLILIFFAALFISSFLGIDPSRSFWGYPERMRGLWGLLHFLLFYFYIIAVFRTGNERKKLVAAALVVGLLVAAYGIAERINPAWSIDKVSLKGPIHRVMSTTGNPIFLAGYMLFIFFLSLYFFLKNNGKARWLGFIGLIFSGLVVIYTGTRGGFLAFVSGLLISAVFVFFVSSRRQKIITAAGVLVAAVFAWFFIFNAPNFALQNKLLNFGRIADFSIDHSVFSRLRMWTAAIEGFRERPFFGWGAENYNYVFDKYYNPQFFRGGLNETWSDRAHNWFLDFLVMGGAIGLALYLSIFGVIACNLLKKKNRVRENFALIGLFAAFAANSFLEVDDPSTTLMLFFALALCSLIFQEEERITNYELRMTNTKKLAFLFCFILVFLSAYFLNIKPLYAGIDFIKFKNETDIEQKKFFAERLLRNSGIYIDDMRMRFATESFWQAGATYDKAYAAWLLDRGIAEMERVLERHPFNYSYYHTLGNLYLRKGADERDAASLEKSIENYKAALLLSPKRQAAMFQLATAYIFSGRAADAVGILKEAVSSDEKVAQPHWRLAVAYLANGQKKEAYDEFKDSISRGFFDTIENELTSAAALCAQFKDYDCVVKIYKTRVDRNKSNADFWAQLAAAYAAAGRYEEAKEAVAEAVKLEPSLGAEARAFLRKMGY